MCKYRLDSCNTKTVRNLDLCSISLNINSFIVNHEKLKKNWNLHGSF